MRLNKFQASFLRKTSKILSDFQTDLQKINAKLNIDKLIVEPQNVQILIGNWSNFVSAIIEDYFVKSIKFKVIPIPKFYVKLTELKHKIDEYLKSNKAVDSVYYEIKIDHIRFACYKEMASKLNPYIRKTFAKVERELYNKNNPLLYVELDVATEPKVNLLLYRKDDFYFNLYKNKIEDFETECFKMENDKIRVVNMALDPKSRKVDSKIDVWKNKIAIASQNFFSTYKSVKIDIPSKWNIGEHFDDLFIKPTYHDRSITVIGPKQKVEQFVKLYKD